MKLQAWSRRLVPLVVLLATLSSARAEPPRPVIGPLGDRELAITNRSEQGILELYVSPAAADSWGQDQLGDDTLDPRKIVRLKLGRMRDCVFDVLVVYEDTSREENRGVNVCRTHDLAFDGSHASAPVEPAGPTRSVTVSNGSRLPIQQLFLSPPDAVQWGDDRLTPSALSTGEERAVTFRGDCNADVRVVFSNRAAEERRGLNLCAHPRLVIAPGWTTADEN